MGALGRADYIGQAILGWTWLGIIRKEIYRIEVHQSVNAKSCYPLETREDVFSPECTPVCFYFYRIFLASCYRINGVLDVIH
jgi:hypothetical protein